jgi:hypothetical protein
MRARIKYATKNAHVKSIGFRHANTAIFRFNSGRGLVVLGIVLLMFSILSVGQGQAVGQVSQSTDSSMQKLDSRWLPWIGSWRLISNVTKTGSVTEISKNTLEIKPGDDGRSVVMKGFQDEKVLYDEKNIIVDGSRRPIKDNDCEGWYKYSWSDTGKRLLFDSEVVCSDGHSRAISGISAFTDPSEWVDVQLLASGEDRMITIRRYRQAGDSQDTPAARSAIHFARVAASANFSIEEVIELSNKVESEVMEAALVEMRKPFEINSDVLLHLANADVSSQVVDLMVALSFPEKFTIERYDSEPAEKPAPREPDTTIIYPYAWSPFGMWSYYDPFFPWYWSSSAYLYGYWGWGGYYPFYWGSPGYGSYGGSGRGYSISGGRLVAGQGYSRVHSGSLNAQPRYAQPRGSSGRVIRGAAGYGSAGAYAGGSGGGSSGGSSGGGSSGGSGSGSPSASPGGYHGGGGGGQAHGR